MPGRLTALVGPNAAGKTTLLRLMLGLLRPWSGSVQLGGLEVTSLSPRIRSRWVSYVPQKAGVRFAFTARQVIAMGAHAQGAAGEEAIEQAIVELALAELADRVYNELSGGQQQRVMIARAQVQSAGGGRVMLLDEPGSHLDLHHRHSTMQRLRTLSARGLAVLVVLHDLDLAMRYADDAWLMDAGRLVAAGAWDRVLTPQLLEPVYGLGLQALDAGGARPVLTVASPVRDTMQ